MSNYTIISTRIQRSIPDVKMSNCQTLSYNKKNKSIKNLNLSEGFLEAHVFKSREKSTV